MQFTRMNLLEATQITMEDHWNDSNADKVMIGDTTNNYCLCSVSCQIQHTQSVKNANEMC